MREYINDTNWGTVFMSALEGGASSFVWMFRIVTLGCVLYLVTVEAGANPQQQVGVISASINGSFLLFVGMAAVSALEELVEQHDLSLKMGADNA